MEYFMEFHWWYLLLLSYVLFALPLPKGKGGFVVKGFNANLEVIDERFKDCQSDASYSIFKQGQPDKIDIEIDGLPLSVGDELELVLNGVMFANEKIKRAHEIEYEYWGDEGVDFPSVKEGDVLVIRYQGKDVLKGRFQLDT